MSSKQNKSSKPSNGNANKTANAVQQTQSTQMPPAPAQNPFMPHIQTVLISEMMPNGQPAILPNNNGNEVQGETVTTAVSNGEKTPRKRGAERNSYPIGVEDFCVAYNTSNNLQEVATKTKMPIAAVASRAQYYKNIGVADGKGGKVKLALKSFRGARVASIDVQKLNERLAGLIAKATV